MRAFLAGAFLAAVQPLDAAFLRVVPAANMSAQAANGTGNSDDSSQALDAVMSMVGSIQAQQEAEKPKPRAPSNSTRPKLDVGFTQYEQNLTQSLVSTIGEAVPPSWDNATKQTVIKEVTSNVTAELHAKLKPLKQAIGKTWMVLPEDAQAVYASQLKENFQKVFADSLHNIDSHIRRCKTRVDIELHKHKPLPHDQLLQKVEGFYIETVALDRCYGGEELLQMSLLELFDSTETRVVEVRNATGNHSHKLKKFCLNSLLTNLASRLHDAQGLLSMTMRFEAHAPMDMNMIQTHKSGLKHHRMHMD